MPQTDQFGGIALDEEPPKTDQFGGILLDHEPAPKTAPATSKLAPAAESMWTQTPSDVYAQIKAAAPPIPNFEIYPPATKETIPQELIGMATEPIWTPETSPEDLAFRKRHPVVGGIEAGIVGLAEGFTSPLGVATLGIGALPRAIQRGVSIAFAAQMAKQTPELAKQLGEEFGKPSDQRDTQKISQLLTEAAGTAAFTSLAAKHGLIPEPPAPPSKIPVTIREIKPSIPKEGVPDAIQPEAAQPVRGMRPRDETQQAGAQVPTQEKGPGTGSGGSQVAEAPGAGLEDVATPADEPSLKVKEIMAKTGLSEDEAMIVARTVLEPEKTAQQGKKVADQLGMRFDGEQMGRWLFTLYDKSGKEGTSIVTKAGASPEEVAKKYESKRAEYGTQENAPRPIKQAKPEGPLEIKETDLEKIPGSSTKQNITDAFVQKALPQLDSVKSWMTILDRVAKGDIPPTNAAEKIGLALRAEGKEAAMPKLRAAAQAYQAARKIADADLESSDPAKQEKAVNILSGSIQVLSEAAEAAVKGNKSDWYDNRTKHPGIEIDPSDTSLDAFDNIKKFRQQNQPQVEAVKALDPQSGKPLTATEALARKMGSETLEVTERLDPRDIQNRISAVESQILIRAKPGELLKIQNEATKRQLSDEDYLKLLETWWLRQQSSPKGIPKTLKRSEPVIPPGPGAQTIGEPPKPELAQLTDALRTLAQGGKRPAPKQAYDLGEKLSQWKEPILKSVDGLKAASKLAKIRLEGLSKWDGLKNALGKKQLALTESVLNARDFADKALKAVPNEADREAITNWIEANGDEAVLAENYRKTDSKYKAGYNRAANLPPELRTVAENIRNYFDSRLQDAIDSGILEDGVEDYIHRMYEKDSNWKRGALAELRSGVFTGKPALAKQRIFQFDADAEAAGYKPVKDFAKRVASYDLSLNKAIADRQMVKEMMDWKMPDGTRAIDVEGSGIPIEDQTTGAREAMLVKPTSSPKARAVTADGRPFMPLDHPALRKWKWVGEDSNGSPIIVQGDVLVHPDAFKQLKAIFGKSKVREYALGRAALATGATVKQTMLDLSGFHPVQITVHGWEHRTFKPVEKIDLEDPNQRALVSHGLVAADPHGYELFSEGLSGSSLTRHIPILGPKLQKYNAWLFQDYIPRLKMAMGLHALERNRARFAEDLKSGKMTEDELHYMTANQANAAFGELNYEMLGRSKTTQDMLRIGLLAPDFLEARGRFAGQAFTKYGAEQRQALLYGAATLYITARIINKLLNGQWHTEPRNAFSVVYNNKAYSLRTVQGDLLHLMTDPMKFAYSRLNPVFGRTALEAVTGRDAFGRKRSPLEQAGDLAKTLIPISTRGLFNKREQTLFESFLNAMGITERRDTANDEVYRLAQKWKEKTGVGQPGEFIYDPKEDPYRGVKLALVFDTPEAAAQEISLALKSGKTDWHKLSTYFTRYGRTAFTGSKANDQKFYASLSDDQKASFQKALAERKRIRENLVKAFSIYRDNFSNVK